MVEKKCLAKTGYYTPSLITMPEVCKILPQTPNAMHSGTAVILNHRKVCGLCLSCQADGIC